jgi:hypothetical protein
VLAARAICAPFQCLCMYVVLKGTRNSPGTSAGNSRDINAINDCGLNCWGKNPEILLSCRLQVAGAPYLLSHQRSYLGTPQCQSHMRSGPTAVIGSDDRNEGRKKAFVSKEMHRATARPGWLLPGPGQYVQASSVCCSTSSTAHGEPPPVHLDTSTPPEPCC